MRKTFRRFAIGMMAFGACYLLAGNVFLNTPLGPWAINHKPDRFQMEWSHGLTWWPGYVALWNVRVNGHVQRVLWQAEADRARGRIALLPLLARELRIASIDADEVTGSIERSAERMLPPPSRNGGWTLHFPRIATSSLRQARIVGLNVRSTGSAEFGFIKQLRGGAMEILPSRVSLRGVTIDQDQNQWLHDGRIEGTFAMARHRRDQAAGIAKLAFTDVELDMQGEVPALSVSLDPSGHWKGTITTSDATGRLDTRLRLQRGVLQPGGVIDVQVPLSASRAGATVNELASLRAMVENDGVRLQITLPPPPEGRGSLHADLRIAATELLDLADTDALLGRTSGALDLDWHFDSLEWLGPLLVKAPWLTLQGAGGVEAALHLRDGQLQPGSRVDVPDVQLWADIAGHRFQGNARAQGNLELVDGTPRASVKLQLPRYEVAAMDASDKLLMRGRDLRLDLDATGELHDFRKSAQARLHFARAEVPDLTAINVYLPTDSLRLLSGRTELSADLKVDALGHITGGRIGILGRGAKVRFADLHMGGDFDLDAAISDSDIATRSFALADTRLKLRNIALLDGERGNGRKWWANLTLRQARIEAARPFLIDAKADLDMQDVGLLLAVFARHSDYPKWALKLVDAGTVHASTRLRMDAKALWFDRVEASNDRFSIKSRLQVAAGKPRGDLLLQWHRLALGLEIDRGEHQFHLLRASHWYDARPPLLDGR
ncbi:MAG: hypothetical protein ABIY56_06120 [Dokdonella sp.]